MKGKYSDIDKSITKRIMGPFKGKVIDTICPYCKGKKYFGKKKCADCNGEGHYKIQY